MEAALDLFVREDDPRRHRFVEAPAPEAADGELLVRVEKFGLSANNVTYAVLGKSPIINYADFFPTGEPGWSRVPVWGIGVVAASRHPSFPTGERMYGYFPLARYTTLRPAATTPLGFTVDRGPLPAVYNQYAPTKNDPFHLPGHEETMIVFRPLVLTGILLDDFIADGNQWFGASSVVIASASSKTSIGLAYMLAKRRGDRAIVGLTSARHAAFVERLGLYTRVVSYDDIPSLPAETPTVFVDVAGDARVRDAVIRRLDKNVRASITVGLSHWDKAGAPGAVPMSDDAVLFFAPGWLEKRREDWGPAVVGQRIASAWHEFMRDVGRWVHVVAGAGKEAVASTYGRMVDGDCGPDEAHVLSLWDDAFAGR